MESRLYPYRNPSCARIYYIETSACIRILEHVRLNEFRVILVINSTVRGVWGATPSTALNTSKKPYLAGFENERLHGPAQRGAKGGRANTIPHKRGNEGNAI